MLGMLITIMMCAIFWNLFVFAIKAAWGIGKIIFSLVLPFVIIGLIISGIIHLVIPVIVIAAIVYFINAAITN